jgi:Rrf2 family protein
MRANTKTRYGIRTMMELVRQGPDQAVHQKVISENQDISYKYLDHIIAGLKSAGLISTVSGKKSGYRLSRSPDKITVYDVYKAFNPRLAVVDCLSDAGLCDRENKCAVRCYWDGLNDVITKYLKSQSIQDLVHEQLELDTQQEGLTYNI